jgi:hypothetical protein
VARLKLRWPHFHSDPDWKIVNCHRLFECRCGARRTRRAYLNIMGPIHPGWPDTMDRHGVDHNDSGWVMPPEGGWPEVTWPTVPPPAPHWHPLPPEE